MRDDCIDILYDYVRPPVPRAEYGDWLCWWEIEPVVVRGELVGAVMALQNEIHIAVKPEHHGKWAIRREMKKRFLTDRIADYGPLRTTVQRSNRAARAFVERLGFQRTQENDTTIEYRLAL